MLQNPANPLITKIVFRQCGIAVQTLAEGGDATIAAKIMLDLPMEEENEENGGRMIQPEEISNVSTNVIHKIYPNPAKDQLLVEYNLSENEKATLLINDITGKHVLSYSLNSLNKSATLNLNGIKSGIYFIALQQNEIIRFSSKLVIIK